MKLASELAPNRSFNHDRIGCNIIETLLIGCSFKISCVDSGSIHTALLTGRRLAGLPALKLSIFSSSTVYGLDPLTSSRSLDGYSGSSWHRFSSFHWCRTGIRTQAYRRQDLLGAHEARLAVFFSRSDVIVT